MNVKDVINAVVMVKATGNGMAQSMRRYPQLFTHIKQESKAGKKPEEWVPVAEKLVNEHGVLPVRRWLNKNGYGGLEQAIRHHPELFSHIKRYKRSNEEWVLIAEKLAKEHDGVLPLRYWLSKNKYGGLAEAINRRPELFDHINQERKFKTPEEWVQIAEKLVKENGGILPWGNWLESNGYGSLDQAIRHHPELFSHIKQDKKSGKSHEEWVLIAERLAKEHAGILPYPRWLKDNGYTGLDRRIRKWPELFSLIKQDSRKRKTPEEWIPIAEKLAKEHGGVLPSTGWLQKNAGGLDQAIRNHPELFAHIRRKDGRRKAS
jgi:hypothetical protein